MDLQITKKSDEELAQNVQAGESRAFAVLVERYEAKILRYARKFLFNNEDSEDIVQEVFIKAYTNIQSFDVSKRFSPWLYRIAHNEFINNLKKKGREPIPFFDADTLWPHPASPDAADKDLDREEMKQMIDKCLDKLDVKYREVLILYYYEELDYKTMADVLRVPISTVGARLKRGREMMNKVLAELEYKI